VTGEIESARDALRSAVAAAKTNPYYGDRLATLSTVLSTKFVDADVASAALDVATMTEATTSAETSIELSWEHQRLAAIYEGTASVLPTTRLAELRERLQQFLLKPGDAVADPARISKGTKNPPVELVLTESQPETVVWQFPSLSCRLLCPLTASFKLVDSGLDYGRGARLCVFRFLLAAKLP
jgi:hypothetical protein